MRFGISAVAVAAALLVGCGQGSGNKAAPAANNSASPNSAAPAAAPAKGTTGANAAAPSAANAQASARPVRIGLDAELDACPSNGQLSGQDTITIHEAPNADARGVAQGEPGMQVHICETMPGWYGVVWTGTTPADDCGVGGHISTAKNYDGPCRSGWVPEQNVELTAG